MGGHTSRPPASAVETYRDRLAAREAVVAREERRHGAISCLRLALAGVAVALFAWQGRSALPWLAAAALAFAGVAAWHGRVLAARDRAARAAGFYRRGLDRLHDRWQGLGSGGDAHAPAGHAAARDLDIFGEGGLFQRLSTPRTHVGEATLAAWLLEPVPPDEVASRQAAVRELRDRLDFREDLFIIGPEASQAVATHALASWAAEPRRLPSWVMPVAPGLVLATTSALVLFAATGQPPPWLLPAAFAQAGVALWLRRSVQAASAGVEARVDDLERLARLLHRLEREAMDSPRLVALAGRLSTTGRPASAEVSRLARIVDVLASRRNQFFAPFAALLLVGTLTAWAVERWRARCGPSVARWVDAVGEFEALAALAGLAFEHPDWAWPRVVEGPPLFDAEEVAHPLLPGDRAVANTVRLGGPHPRVLLVSGSNMSGKSTLLRTVGITTALAHAGAPVRARRLTMTQLRAGATLRVQDSLQDGQSRFFAEITRIASIVRMAREAGTEGQPGILFLLDEVLAGTNSHDRQQGAAAIIRGLVDLGAIGLVTTHDLALTAFVADMGARAANVHFEDRFEDGVLHFDYRLREGVVRTSNALALMRSVGLDV